MFHETTSGQIQVPRPSGKATKLFKHGVKTSKIGTTAVDRPEGLTTSSSKAYKTSALISKAEKANSEMYLGFHTQGIGSMSMAEVEVGQPEVESSDSSVSSTADSPVVSSSTPTFSPTSSTPAPSIAAATDAPVASLTDAPTDAVITSFPTSPAAEIGAPVYTSQSPVAGGTTNPTPLVTGTDPTDAPIGLEVRAHYLKCIYTLACLFACHPV